MQKLSIVYLLGDSVPFIIASVTLPSKKLYHGPNKQQGHNCKRNHQTNERTSRYLNRIIARLRGGCRTRQKIEDLTSDDLYLIDVVRVSFKWFLVRITQRIDQHRQSVFLRKDVVKTTHIL